MAHKTLIGGTAYEIAGGKSLIGGTAYSKAKGRTLVGGTGYDISFDNTCLVTLAGTWKYNAQKKMYCYVTIGGVRYTSNQTVEVQPGTEITCTVYNNTSWNGDIYVNGEAIATQSYTFTVQSDVFISGAYNARCIVVSDDGRNRYTINTTGGTWSVFIDRTTIPVQTYAYGPVLEGNNIELCVRESYLVGYAGVSGSESYYTISVLLNGESVGSANSYGGTSGILTRKGVDGDGNYYTVLITVTGNITAGHTGNNNTGQNTFTITME